MDDDDWTPHWRVTWQNGATGPGRDDLPQGLVATSDVLCDDSLVALQMVACRGVTPLAVRRIS